jgi:hypothetical protein
VPYTIPEDVSFGINSRFALYYTWRCKFWY